jgi:hypothetical protein
MSMSEYKKYSLDNLKTWIQDAISSGGASPKEIYDTIVEAVNEEYYIYKHHTSQCYELLALLNGNGKGHIQAYDDYLEKKENLVCDKDDKSPECQKSWTSFWEENYYPEEVKDDGMHPWGHSDLEYSIANPGPHQKYIGWKTVSESKFNEMFPNREKFKNEISRNDPNRLDYKDGYIYESPDGGKTVYARKPGDTQKTLIKEKKVKKWVLPVQQSVVDGTDDYYVNFPNDLLEAANLKEGDQVEWVSQGDGSYLIRKTDTVIHHPV